MESDLAEVLGDEILDWQSLIVLANNQDENVRIGIVKLIHGNDF